MGINVHKLAPDIVPLIPALLERFPRPWTVQSVRADMDERIAPTPFELADVLTDDAWFGEVPVRVYSGSPRPCPTIMYLHGGGWVAGSINTHDAICRRLAKATRLSGSGPPQGQRPRDQSSSR